jgi:hypothetical protein
MATGDAVKFVGSDPTIYYDYVDTNSRSIEPERELWGAVMYQALVDYAFGREHDSRLSFRVAPSLKEWVTYEGEETGSFRYVCAVLNLSPTAASKTILKYTRHQMRALLKSKAFLENFKITVNE